jgi:integrase/recombinase XerC
MHIFTHTSRPPRTLTTAEQQQLMDVTAGHPAGYRDHVLYSLALGTGLREHELVALNVGDIYVPAASGPGRARRWVTLRVFKRCRADRRDQEILLPDGLRQKLERYHQWKQYEGQGTAPADPLFVSLKGLRLSTRQVRHAFGVWQRRAGFERTLSFHSLRHSACTHLYRATKDIRLTQRFARHASIATTQIYTHTSDEDLLRAVQSLAC